MKKNNVFKRAFAIICATSICLNMNCVLADAITDAQDKVNNINNQIKENQNQQSSVQSEAQAYISQIAALDTQISEYETKLSTLKTSQEDINTKIEGFQSELQNSAQLFNSAEDVYLTRVRAIYENGIPSVFEILVSSNGISDFFAKLGVYTSILEYDQNIIDNMKSQKEYVDYLKAEIDDAKLSLEAISYDVEKSTEALENVRAQKQTKVSELQASATKLKQVENELNEEKAAANSALAAAIEAARPKYGGGGNNTYTSTTFIWPTTSSYITAGFGTYYVWGFAQQHNGVDIGVGVGTPVYAAATGTVIIATVVTPAPYWVSYPQMVKLADGEPVIVEATFEQNFKITPEQLEAAITPKTRALILCSPSNPTGSVYTKEELEALADVLKKHERVIVIADEIYEHLNYTGIKHASMASVDGMKERTVIINGVSKAYAMTGWRIGFIAAPEWIVKGCNKLQGQYTSGPCSVSQKAAEAAYTGSQEPRETMRKAFERRRDLIEKLAKEIPGFGVNHPTGAFYLFPKIDSYFGKSYNGTTINNSTDFAMYLLNEAHVATVGGDAFGSPKCFRMSYATSDENITEAMKRIKEACAKLK